MEKVHSKLGAVQVFDVMALLVQNISQYNI
jgi:hypothetical protein